MIHRQPRFFGLATSIAIGLWTVSWALSPASGGKASEPVGPSTADDAKTLRELERELNTAVVRGDAATFDRLLADDFTHTSQDGRFRTRVEWMKGRVQGKTNYVSYDVDDLQIRIYGEAAVATGMSKPSWRESDGTLASGRYRFLRVWARRDGHWRAVAFQSTRVLDQKD